MRYTAVCSATVLCVIAFQGSSAHALSMHECSAKYQAAKTAGTLNGMKWNEFRKTECGGEATAAPVPAAAPLPTPTAHGLSMRECSAKYQAAKTAGTLNGLKWNEFRKTECGAEATAEPAPATAAAPAPASAPTAHALSMRECSAKYQSAKVGGTLNGMKWNEFRKTQCGAEAMAAPAPTPAAGPAPATRSAAPVAIGNAVFPSAIDPKYSNESAGKARRETCLEQYNANKANNANGGLKWIQRGGGYYSECNRRLKGQA